MTIASIARAAARRLTSSRPLRVAYGRIFHEANAFSPLPTTLEDFERLHLLSGEPLAQATTLRGTELKSFMPHAELTGFRQAARLSGGVTTLPLLSAMAVPGGSLTAECFANLTGRLLDEIERALPLDGVYLALHGSMQVEGLNEAPEAALLRRVRQLVGPNVKIAVSYDLHANLSRGLVEPVDVLVAYRTNPHWDLAPTGFRAGERLLAVIRGEHRPSHAWRKLPLLIGGGTTIDFAAPMRSVFRWMKRLERDPRVISASLFMVHPFTSAERLGWAVHVATNGDPALAAELADRLADRVWETRDVELPPFLDVASALDQAQASPLRRLGPITFVDVDDIVGAGAPGGNTRIVKAIVESGRDLTAFVPVHDPALVDELWPLPEGSRRRVVLRGTNGYGAPEVALDVVVRSRAEADFGRVLRLDVGRLHLVVCARPPLPIHPSFWSALGLVPRDADIIVQKNFFHYRMFYLTTSFKHIPVATAGATSLSDARRRAYDVPMAPQARLADWRPYAAELREPRAVPGLVSAASRIATLRD